MLCYDGDDMCDSQHTHVTTLTHTHTHNKTRIHNIIVTSVGWLPQNHDANIFELPSFTGIVHFMYVYMSQLNVCMYTYRVFRRIRRFLARKRA